MKINHLLITNWHEPGGQWWDSVKERPSEPLIEATIQMTLSWEEYKDLLDRDKETRNTILT